MQNLTWQGEIKPSRTFAFLLLALHLGSAVVVYLTSIAWAVKWMLLVLIVLSLFFYWTRDVRLTRTSSWLKLTLDQNSVTVGVRGKKSMRGHLANAGMVLGYFVILAVRLEGRHLSAFRVIFRDAMHPEAFRALCVFLNFSR